MFVMMVLAAVYCHLSPHYCLDFLCRCHHHRDHNDEPNLVVSKTIVTIGHRAIHPVMLCHDGAAMYPMPTTNDCCSYCHHHHHRFAICRTTNDVWLCSVLIAVDCYGHSLTTHCDRFHPHLPKNHFHWPLARNTNCLQSL